MMTSEFPTQRRHLTVRVPRSRQFLVLLPTIALGILVTEPAKATAPPTASFPTAEEVTPAPTAHPPSPPAATKPRATPAVPAVSASEPVPANRAEPRGADAEPQWRRLPTLFKPSPGAGTGVPRDSAAASEEPVAPETWIWSLEGVSRAPVDVGFQSVFETSFGLRLGGGYAWVPSAYLDFVTQAAGTDNGNVVAALDGGRTLRGFVGLRPSKKVGVVFDAGYSRVRLTGTLDDPGAVQGVSLGRFDLESNLDMWFVELGYQGHLGRHAILGIGIGLMGTLNASTDATPDQSVPSTVSEALTKEATDTVDSQIEQYGFVPTLTLRLGFDLI